MKTTTIGIALRVDDVPYAELLADIVRKKLEHDGIDHFIIIERGKTFEIKE